MKINACIIFICLFILLCGIASAEIPPLDYTLAVPGAHDLTMEEAEAIADSYFQRHNDRFFINHEDLSQFQKSTHFIRVVQQNEPLYCWVVAYNDNNLMWANYGFAGMVVISSPDGRVVHYSTNSYWETFGNWDTALTSNRKSSAEVWGAIDLIALPEDNRIRHVIPDMYTIHEEEATAIANQLVAGYQHISLDDVSIDYEFSVWLDRDLLVSDYPIWHFQYMYSPIATDENSPQKQLHYSITIYAHTGTVWYVIDEMTDQVIYADHSYCHSSLSEDSFDPYEWKYSHYSLLFNEP